MVSEDTFVVQLGWLLLLGLLGLEFRGGLRGLAVLVGLRLPAHY